MLAGLSVLEETPVREMTEQSPRGNHAVEIVDGVGQNGPDEEFVEEDNHHLVEVQLEEVVQSLQGRRPRHGQPKQRRPKVTTSYQRPSRAQGMRGFMLSTEKLSPHRSVRSPPSNSSVVSSSS